MTSSHTASPGSSRTSSSFFHQLSPCSSASSQSNWVSSPTPAATEQSKLYSQFARFTPNSGACLYSGKYSSGQQTQQSNPRTTPNATERISSGSHQFSSLSPFVLPPTPPIEKSHDILPHFGSLSNPNSTLMMDLVPGAESSSAAAAAALAAAAAAAAASSIDMKPGSYYMSSHNAHQHHQHHNAGQLHSQQQSTAHQGHHGQGHGHAHQQSSQTQSHHLSHHHSHHHPHHMLSSLSSLGNAASATQGLVGCSSSKPREGTGGGELVASTSSSTSSSSTSSSSNSSTSGNNINGNNNPFLATSTSLSPYYATPYGQVTSAGSLVGHHGASSADMLGLHHHSLQQHPSHAAHHPYHPYATGASSPYGPFASHTNCSTPSSMTSASSLLNAKSCLGGTLSSLSTNGHNNIKGHSRNKGRSSTGKGPFLCFVFAFILFFSFLLFLLFFCSFHNPNLHASNSLIFLNPTLVQLSNLSG